MLFIFYATYDTFVCFIICTYIQPALICKLVFNNNEQIIFLNITLIKLFPIFNGKKYEKVLRMPYNNYKYTIYMWMCV